MSNMKIRFWHNPASAETTDIPMRETNIAVGTLSSTFYLGATDAQELLNAMWAKGQCDPGKSWFDQDNESLLR